MQMNDEAMSILARRHAFPSSNSPFFIFSKRARFSSTVLSLYGLFLPGAVRVPLYSLISSGKNGTFTEQQSIAADWNGDDHIDSVDASAILAKYAELQTL